jgi:hypothetical protein
MARELDRFIEDYNTCIQTPACDFEKYRDKVVTWSGRFERVKPMNDGVAVRVSLTPHTLLDKDGKPRERTVPPQPLKDIDLQCKPPEADKWQTLTAGTVVTFRGKTPPGGAIQFSRLGDQTLVLYYLIGCELVTGGEAR